MRLSLALGRRGAISRETAWGCFTGNLALPGSGSLLAGRRSGYGQIALSLTGMAVSTVTGVRFLSWYVMNFSQLNDGGLDQFMQVLRQLKWPVLGLAVFGLGWIWALFTSLQILRSARCEKDRVPRKLS